MGLAVGRLPLALCFAVSGAAALVAALASLRGKASPAVHTGEAAEIVR